MTDFWNFLVFILIKQQLNLYVNFLKLVT